MNCTCGEDDEMRGENSQWPTAAKFAISPRERHALRAPRGLPALVLICLAEMSIWTTIASRLVAAQPLDRVVATVDGIEITDRQVRREMDLALGDRPLQPEARDSLFQVTLEQLVDRCLILQYLKQHNLGASDDDLDQALRRVGKQLETQQVTLDQYLQQAGVTQAEFRRVLAWQIGWQRYLDRYRTDENLERYYNQHRRDFDGTEIHVAHILFKVDAAGDPQAVEIAVKRAEEVAKEIRRGNLTFEDAAARYSAAPTAPTGGDIGFIRRHEPMPESFSQAGFALDQGQISPPVVTPFGVHLIRCLEIKPGTKSWEQVRKPLERAVTEYLFRWVADQQRPHSKITIHSGSLP